MLTAYGVTTVALAVAVVGLTVRTVRSGAIRRLTTTDLATAALVVCLLHAATIPWAVSLARVPGLDALVYSIPYTAVLILGLRLLPKPGAATLILVTQGLVGQLLGHGINPLWWPYYLWCAATVELGLALSRYDARPLRWAVTIGIARGLVSYGYTYLIMAPLAWHHYYPAWYIAAKTALGVVGCAIGAYAAWRLGPRVESHAAIAP